jgi:hypothetical protein
MATIEHGPTENTTLDQAIQKITAEHPLSEDEQQKRLGEVNDLRPAVEQGLEELYAAHLTAQDSSEDRPQPGVIPRQRFFELVADQLKATSVYAAAVQEDWGPTEIRQLKAVRAETDLGFRRAFSVDKKHEVDITPTATSDQSENISRNVLQAYAEYPESVLHSIQDMQENLIIGIRDGADQFVNGHLDMVRSYGNESLHEG